MVRKQIYLTERQRDELSPIAKTVGRKQIELIREAIDSFIDQSGHSRPNADLKMGFTVPQVPEEHDIPEAFVRSTA